MIVADALNVRDPLRLERRRLLEHITRRDYAYLLAHAEDPLSEHQEHLFLQCLSRLQTGEPLAYILGEQEFYGITFQVTPAVLIPRPDTELLVEEAHKVIRSLAHPSAIDLGTGSGAIAITLSLLCPTLRITATDISSSALAVAQHNAQRLVQDSASRISWLTSDWFDSVTDTFDVILSNPPYIAMGDPHLKGEGLPFEPEIALTSGPQGRQALACIIEQAPRFLKRPGYMFIEHGYNQEVFVQNAMEQAGFVKISTHLDLNRLPRLTQGMLG
ncbi:release factor glutamine methyltransferase [Ferrovum sp. JA12]|uniref:peptide chain release factor N(5)-glutamine methyltransferase n=1 Tax=Ferrovum sp. JA12 TaxID=1356299 RepID=UPI0007037E26|nr:peptide chain release factor N(5)-glutamine methyltransferase [Ferrovum sp. JA12]KRH79149.1 release factor glutamine methyltransferase [Ferrovum sp. JA12]